jgi:hypothetical protein
MLCAGADKPDNVVLQYHFVGASQLADNTNAAVAKRVFGLVTTIKYEDSVLDQLSIKLAESLHFQPEAATVSAFGTLLFNSMRAESIASMGGSPDKPINFVVAVHLGTDAAAAWPGKLKTATHGTGDELNVENFTGWQWNKGTDGSFWMVPAGEWLLVGRGGDLASVRSDYLQQIQKTGRPGPVLDSNCLEADVDWPRLANWAPLSSCPLKLARTQIAIAAEKGRFHMTTHVTYPEEISWQPSPMSLPTTLVREPLTSFATGQNVEPFLKSDETLSRFCTDPLKDQFYFWSMGEMAFQSYVAWPVKGPVGTLRTLSTQAVPELNPKLEKLDGTQLIWNPKLSRLIWSKLQLMTPVVQAVPASNGQFLVAGMFALTPGKKSAPNALWAQFQNRTNLVYYDWELTGPRIRHLITVTEILPILQVLGIGPDGASVADGSGVNTPDDPGTQARLILQKNWLLGLAPLLGNTITEVTKTGPNELTILRSSPFILNSLELVLLSHCLSDTSAGALDMSLLPQAKMSGPGMPSQ